MQIVCAAKNCKYSSESEDSAHVMFINFPNDDTSKIWAHHCGRTDLLMKTNEELHLNYYICSHHIEDRYYISKTDPVIIDQQALPTLFKSDSEKETRNLLERTEHIEVADNVVLSYCDMDIEIDQYRDISIKFSNLCRICGESSLDSIEIFSLKGMELKLKEKIILHLPITVDMEDLMPQKLCLSCYNKLEIAHSLVVASLRTDMRLKRFLNISEELNYDYKYNAIAKRCSVEIAEEICMSETSREISTNKVEGVNQEIISSHLENAHKSNFASSKRREAQCESLSGYQHSDMEDNKEAEYQDKIGKIAGIQCICCQDTFKTQEIFENHKILCDEEEIVVQKEKEIKGAINSKQSKITSFQFTTKACIVCNKHFENEDHLQEHRISCCEILQDQISDKANENRENTCDIYNIPLPATETIKKCGHCDLICSTKKELLNHIVEFHKGHFLFKCVTCDRSFEKWSSLDVHEATHRMDKPYLCDLCGKSFKHSNNLRGHKRTHLDDSRKKQHVCDICGNAFRSRFHLAEHMNQHIGNKPYACEKCNKTFYKRIQLRQHKLSHGLSKHACPICGAAFNRKGNMNAHLKRHNNGDSTYTCSVCAYRCKSMSELKIHRKKHTEEDIIESVRKNCGNKTVWQCENCTRAFLTRTAFLNHKRMHEGERTNVECDICGKKLASKNSLTYHKKSMHSSERPHMCQFCGESFVSKEARLIHERIHTGERPYICKVCKMEYKCSSNLNQHMKIHSDVKPYKCGYCSKSFARKSTLNVHERIHTGEKPFACGICRRPFSQKNDMTKHIKTHEAKSLQCEECDEVFVKKKDILKHTALHMHNNMMQELVEARQVVAP